MLFRNTCCKLICPHLKPKSVGGLHVSLSDWLASGTSLIVVRCRQVEV